MLIEISLLIIGIAAIIIEFFVPAFGIVGILGGGSIIAGIVMVYRRAGPRIGSIFLISAIILVPLLIIIYFKIFPRSFIGRRLILSKNQEQKEGYTSYTADKYAGLTGKNGETLTDLRPVGNIIIDKKRYSALTSGEYIDKGKKIYVSKIEGSRIIVRERSGEC